MAGRHTGAGSAVKYLYMWKAYHLIKVSFVAALTGIICCIGPVILFQFGIIGGIYAISFADFFYSDDGSIGFGAILLRIIAVCLGFFAFITFRRKQNQCSIDPKRKKLNLILLFILLTTFGICFFLIFESTSTWYFDEFIVPQQQIELKK